MSVKHLKSETRTTVIDHNTGEVKSDISAKVVQLRPEVLEEPKFVKVYLKDISNLSGLPLAVQPLLFEIMAKVDYKGILSISANFRKELCEYLNISRPTLRNRLAILTKKGIMKSVGGGDYEMNPDYFAKGTWKDIVLRKKNFKLEIEYSISRKRTVKTSSVEPEGGTRPIPS